MTTIQQQYEDTLRENERLMKRESEAVTQATRDAARADANAAECGRLNERVRVLSALLAEYLTYDCPAHMAPAAGSLPHRARLALRESAPTSAEEQLKAALWNYREQHGKPALKEFLGGYLQLPR